MKWWLKLYDLMNNVMMNEMNDLKNNEMINMTLWLMKWFDLMIYEMIYMTQ